MANTEANRLQEAFEHAADACQAAFQHELDDAVHGLRLVNRLVSSNGEVNGQQFQDLAEQLVELHPYVQAFSFVRVLSPEQRPTFEAQLRQRQGDLAITEIRDGKRVAATERSRYHVVDRIASVLTSTKVMGLEVSSIVDSEAAAERARTTGLPSATGMFNLLPEAGGQHAFAVLMPVYHSGSARDRTVVGYTAVVLRAHALVESVMRRIALVHEQDIEVSIVLGNGSNTKLVYHTGMASDGADVNVMGTNWLAERRVPGTTRWIDAAGMRWLIVSKPSQDKMGSTVASAWLILAGGAAVSILLALYLQSLAVRAADLARINARLEKDIDARKRIESALRASEERFQRLANMSSDWYWEQDVEFRFTMISGETIFGDTPTQSLLGKTRWEVPLEVDKKDFEEHVRLVNSHQPFSDLEYRVRDKSGHGHWMSISGEPLYGKDGEFRGYRGTGKDITARKEAEQALRQSQTELRELAAHQERVKEDERKRIAREIHDDLGQNLLALRIDVTLLENEVRLRHPELSERIHGLLSQVDNVMRSTRTIVNDLRPAVLDLGLQCAIEWQVQQFRQRSGVSCTLVMEGGEMDSMLNEEAATSVFRILQESLTNVSRHAYATHVDIHLQRKSDNLVLEIADDGIGGFQGNMRKPRSFGLIGIRERVFTLGGEFRMISAPGKGTTLIITIPASTGSTASTPSTPSVTSTAAA